ncbi:MAG: hypothetical protein OXF84_00120 [Bacteroidetes bacterium]|nr:hypothetical protein [Bacteroidota bacterium]
MSSDINILKRLIIKNVLVPVSKNNYDKYFLVLNDYGRSSSYHIKIVNLPEETIAIKTDRFPFTKKIFRCNNGECKMADYVVISNDLDQKWIIYIELKLGSNGKPKQIIQQLEGSKCFIHYCREVGKTFLHEPEFLDPTNYQERYISVKNIGVAKRSSNILTKPGVHDHASNMLRISAPPPKGIRFEQLINIDG